MPTLMVYESLVWALGAPILGNSQMTQLDSEPPIGALLKELQVLGFALSHK